MNILYKTVLKPSRYYFIQQTIAFTKEWKTNEKTFNSFILNHFETKVILLY